MTLTLTRGVIGTDELSGLSALWDRAIDVIPPSRVTDWQPLLSAIRSVASPEILRGDPGDDFRAQTRACAVAAINRLAKVASSRLGVLLELRTISKWIGFDPSLEIDPHFAVLYPEDDWENYDEHMRRCADSVRALAVHFLERTAADIAKQISTYYNEAKSVGRREGLLDVLGTAFAEKCRDAKELLTAFAGNDGDYLVIPPLLERLHAEGESRWVDACRLCWTKSDLRPAVVVTVLSRENAPEDLVQEVLAGLSPYSQSVYIWCLRRRISTSALKRLLSHADHAVAAAAAVGEWQSATRGDVRPEVQDLWRAAFIRCGAGEQQRGRSLHLRDILAADSELAFDWMLARVLEGVPLYQLSEYDLDGALPTLSADQRFSLLVALGRSETYAPDELVVKLVAGDPHIYRRLLAEPGTERLHLRMLTGRPSLTWASFAIAALDAGYTAKQVALAAEGTIQSWNGPASEYWNTWKTAWEELLVVEDRRVQETARIGVETAIRNRDAALKREEAEQIFGR